MVNDIPNRILDGFVHFPLAIQVDTRENPVCKENIEDILKLFADQIVRISLALERLYKVNQIVCLLLVHFDRLRAQSHGRALELILCRVSSIKSLEVTNLITIVFFVR